MEKVMILTEKRKPVNTFLRLIVDKLPTHPTLTLNVIRVAYAAGKVAAGVELQEAFTKKFEEKTQ
jgi:hypothetical protein